MIKYRQGTNVPFVVELLWDDGQPIDLTDAIEVKLVIRDEETFDIVYSGLCDIVSPTTGKIVHYWGDTSTLYGIYLREIHVKYSDGVVNIIPSEGFEYIMFW